MSKDAPLSPGGGAEGGRVKSWLKKTFSIRHSRTASTLYDDDHHESKTTDQEPSVVDHETASKSVPDATDPDDSHGDRLDSISGSKQAESEYVIPSPVQPRDHLHRTATHVSSDSELSDDVAAAGKRERGRESNKRGFFPRIGAGALAIGGHRNDKEGVSPLSSGDNDNDDNDDDDNDEFTEARDGLGDDLLPPPTLITADLKRDKGKGSPASGSRFRESLEEL